MRRLFVAVLTLAVMLTMSFGVTAFAATAETVDYYDENGNLITVNGMYYNNQGCPMFNSGCYYTDADGNPAYVGGCGVYYRDADGNLVAGKYYYDADGNAVKSPSSYPGGYGCGSYCYNAQGNAVGGTYYYNDFGNRVNPPATNRTPANYSHGCGGCGSRR